MKRIYRKPKLYILPNMGSLSNAQLIPLSDNEFALYMQKSKEIEYAKVYKANPNLIMRKGGDECVLVPTNFEIDINALITLNPTAEFLWKQFETPSTIPQVLAKARAAHDDEDGSMENEIRCFVNDYVQYNFITEEKS